MWRAQVHPTENELVAAAAIAHPDVRRAGWRLAPANTHLRSWPCGGLPLAPAVASCLRSGPEWLTNGFFVARFVRAARE